jgi:hypothetical protein
LVHCSDPKASDPDHPTPECSPTNYASLLSKDPANPQSSLKAYLDAALALSSATDEVTKQLTDACNALATELQLPTGDTLQAACQALATRVDAVNANYPAPPPPLGGPAEIRFGNTCTTDLDLAKCVSTCATGACDNTKCDPTATSGKCEGKCTGLCVTTGDNAHCEGACVGEVPIPADPTTCNGKCEGFGTAPIFEGQCALGCAAGFVGFCGGTCTGTCDRTPINPQPQVDAGADAAPPPFPPKPPDNAKGNCLGLCQGSCGSNADGFCSGWFCWDYSINAPVAFTGNAFDKCGFQSPTQPGKCTSANGTGSGTTKTCSGVCTTRMAGEPCSGTCQGTCSTPLQNVACSGSVSCGQNDQCGQACQALSAAKATCKDAAVTEIYALGDPTLAAAWQKHAAKFGAASQRVAKLRQAQDLIADRSYGDFVVIGAKGLFTSRCVDLGAKTVSDAAAKIAVINTVNPAFRRTR